MTEETGAGNQLGLLWMDLEEIELGFKEKKDQGSGSGDCDDQRNAEGGMEEDAADERADDDDLLEDEDRRNKRNQEEVVREKVMQGEQVSDPIVADLVNSDGTENVDGIEMEVATNRDSQKDENLTGVIGDKPKKKKEISQGSPAKEKVYVLSEGSKELAMVNDRQMVVYQEAEGRLNAGQMEKVAIAGGTRQSLRQKLLQPEKPIPEKAAHRMKERNLEIHPAVKNSSMDKFPFIDLADSEVLDLFECCGLILADNKNEGIEIGAIS